MFPSLQNKNKLYPLKPRLSQTGTKRKKGLYQVLLYDSVIKTVLSTVTQFPKADEWRASYEASSLCLSLPCKSGVLIVSPSVLRSHYVSVSASIDLYAKPANTELKKIHCIELGMMRWHSGCRHCQSSLMNWDQFLGLTTVWKERINCM